MPRAPARPAMNEDILINVTPQETRVALIVQGAVQELHIERTLTARPAPATSISGKVVRVLPGMQSAFIDIGLERAAFLHVADIWEARAARRPATARRTPIEKLLFDGQVADGAGDQGPDRHQGRAAVDADLDRRPHAGLPAAGSAHRHLAEASRTKPSAKRCAARCRRCCRRTKKAASSSAPWPRTRRDADLAGRRRLPAQDLGRDHARRAHEPPGRQRCCTRT